MKDYSRKHYTDYQFHDWMRAHPAKSIWNSILSQSIGYGEFSLNKNRKSSLSSSIALYLKQSERKKPYMGSGFIQMEDDWEGPIGGFTPPDPYSIPTFDQPWNMQPGGGGLPWMVVFDLEGNDCWCRSETRSFSVSGTHPIYGLSISNHKSGTYITILGGFGTNTVSGTITADPDEIGNVNFTGYMTTAGGISGSSNDLMYECRNCELCVDTDPLAAGSNPETVAQDDSATLLILDGVGPFEWSVSGSGFSLESSTTSERSNTLYTTVDACGTATITVTDVCEGEISIEVRSDGDSAWVFKSNTCSLGGAATEGDGRTRIVGGKKQYEGYTTLGGSGCATNPCRQPCPGDAVGCITYDCVALTGDPGAYEEPGGIGCCNIPCGGSQTICSFKSYYGVGISYYEWECV
jgi:hypothetical protein